MPGKSVEEVIEGTRPLVLLLLVRKRVVCRRFGVLLERFGSGQEDGQESQSGLARYEHQPSFTKWALRAAETYFCPSQLVQIIALDEQAKHASNDA